jgi:hypothetical protein
VLDGEQGGSLLGREGKVRGADLGQPTDGPKPSNPQTRIGAGEDDQVSPRGQVLDEELHLRVTRDILQDVEVVEHDDEVLLQVGHGLEQPRQDPGDHLAVMRPHEAGDVVLRPALDTLERHGHMGPETYRVVVTVVEGDPSGLTRPVARQPLGHQCGLPEACRGGNQDHRPLDSLVQESQQPTSLHPVGAGRWGLQLGLENGVGERADRGRPIVGTVVFSPSHCAPHSRCAL